MLPEKLLDGLEQQVSLAKGRGERGSANIR